jgi:hypothetical protein
MTDYTYVTQEEVRKVCREIGVRDWTDLAGAEINDDEAEIIRKIVGGETAEIPLNEFKLGLEIELEHGLGMPDANVTNNHPILTGRIVLAHLKEGLDYYLRLECMELEMELTAALVSKDAERAAKKRGDLATAREKLEAGISRRMG